MVGRFLRLRLALFRAGFKTGNIGTTIGTVLGLIWAATSGLLGLVGGSFLRIMDPELLAIVLPITLGAVYLVWLLGPITIAGSDAAMDPVKFALLPLNRRDLAAGLAAAAFVGPGGTATTLTVLGMMIGLVPPGLGLVGVIAGGLLFCALCILSSRFLVSLVGMGLRRRGVRDVLAVAIPLVVVLVAQVPNIVQNVARAAGPEFTQNALRTTLQVVRFLPSSFAAQAMLGGARGEVLLPLLEVAGGALFCGLVGWGWARLLGRAMTTPPGLEGTAKAQRRRTFRTVRVIPWLTPRAGAVSDKDLILSFREPAQRVGLIMAVILALAAAVVPLFLTTDPRIGFMGVGLALLVAMIQANMYGYDGSSTWVNVAAGDDAASDLTGKIVARLLVFTPIIVVVALVPGFVVGWSLLPATAGIALGTWLVGLGLATLQSVITPYPIVYSADSVMPRNQGSLQAVIAQFVTFPVVAILMGPFAALALLGPAPWAVWGSGVGAIVVGVLALGLARRLAVAYAQPRQPELLEKVSKRAEA